MSFTPIHNAPQLSDGYILAGEIKDGSAPAYLVDHPERGRAMLCLVSDSWRSRLDLLVPEEGEQHPNLIQYFGQLFYQGRCYAVIEYVPRRPIGESLGLLVTGTVDVVALMMKIALATEALHSLGLTHGAISAATIHLTDCLDVKIELPFQSQLPENSLAISQAKSPERWLGYEASVVSDIYSLGVVFYELLTHEVPFRASDYRALEQMHLIQKPTPPGMLVLCHPDLESLVGRMLFKEPLGRPQSVAQVLEALVRIPVSTVHPTITREREVDIKPSRLLYRPVAFCSVAFICIVFLWIGLLMYVENTEVLQLANYIELGEPLVYEARSIKVVSGAKKHNDLQIRFQVVGSGELHEYRSKSLEDEQLAQVWRTRPNGTGDVVVYRPFRQAVLGAGLTCDDEVDCWAYEHSGFEWLPLVDLRVHGNQLLPLYTWSSSSRRTPIQVYAQDHKKIADYHFNNFGRAWQIEPTSLGGFRSWLEQWLVTLGVDKSWSVEVGVIPVKVLVVRHFFDCSLEENDFGRFSRRCATFEDSIWGANRSGEALGRILLASGKIKGGKLSAQEVLWVIGVASREAAAV